MKVIRSATVEATPRPNGRTVKRLAQVKVDRRVDEVAVLDAYHPPKFVEEAHAHQVMYEIFVFQHDARYQVNGEPVELKAGDVLILEPGDVHGATAVDHGVNILVLQVPAIAGDRTPKV